MESVSLCVGHNGLLMVCVCVCLCMHARWYQSLWKWMAIGLNYWFSLEQVDIHPVGQTRGKGHPHYQTSSSIILSHPKLNQQHNNGMTMHGRARKDQLLHIWLACELHNVLLLLTLFFKGNVRSVSLCVTTFFVCLDVSFYFKRTFILLEKTGFS